MTPPVGITPERLAEVYPKLWHMAWEGSWLSIKKHGLMSTSALLDRLAVRGAQRRALEREHRPDSIELTHPRFGSAVVRDQKPMSDGGLRRALKDGLTPEDWYMLLNRKVFFWLSEDRLLRMLSARAYRSMRQTVLTVDTGSLLSRHASRVTLAPMNTGCTTPWAHPRGRDTFLALRRYPFEASRRKRGLLGAVVELAVRDAVPDISDHVLRVEEYNEQKPSKLIWKAPTMRGH